MRRVFIRWSVAWLAAIGSFWSPQAYTAGAAGASDQAAYRAPSDGGVRRWRVTPGGDVAIRASSSPRARIVSTVVEGAVLSNMGCSSVDGDLWCDVRPFRGGPRGFVPAARLAPATGPDGLVPMGQDTSRTRALKRKFDASTNVPCAQEKGQSLGNCSAGVARGDGGDATVAVRFANGFSRRLYFIHGEFVSASTTMSGAGRDVDWRLENGTHMIRVDDQRFELPDAFVFGAD